MIRLVYLLSSLLFILVSCASDPREESTRVMADSLALIAQKADPQNYIYANSKAVEQLAAMVKPVPYDKPFNLRLPYCRHLIYAGRFEEGILEIENTLEARFANQPINPYNRPYYELLAIAYLRLGEQENCLINHTAESCLLPISGDGIHSLRSGSENAIRVFNQLLEYDSTDMQSRWLLNIAHMTLGEYPNGVPEQYLIPDTVFDSSVEFPRFHDRAISLGLDHIALAGGSVTDDFNNDGYLDIFATSWGLSDQVKLWLSNGEGGYDDVTEEAGLMGITGGLNAIQADYDNDGLTDILILRGGWLRRTVAQPNSLLKNLGDGRFRDVTREAGLYSRYPTQTAVWSDINLDGHIDLIVGNEWYPFEVFINQQDGTFSEKASEWIGDHRKLTKGIVAGDANNDMLPDLYVSTLTGENMLLINQGDRFRDEGRKAGVGEPDMSFPAWWFDYDQDGNEDIFVAGFKITSNGGSDMTEMFRSLTRNVALDYLGQPHEGESPRLYRNLGDGTFLDMSDSVGLNTVLYAMGSNFGDLNNDGYPDFYIGTGAPDFNSQIPNRMFLNGQGTEFYDVTTKAGGFGQIQKGHGISWADLDNDGDQDIYTVIGGAMEGDVYGNMLYENPGFGNHWVTLKLEGRTANRSAIGARVEIDVSMQDGLKKTFYHRIGSGGSFGASSLQLEAGLGAARKIDEVRITWPDKNKSVQILQIDKMDKRYRIVQGQSPEPTDEQRLTWATGHMAH